MLRIEEPLYFLGLFTILCIVVIGYFYSKYAKKLNHLFSLSNQAQQLARKAWRHKTFYFSLGLLFIILAMTNPQYGYRKEQVNRESADVFIALDISRSMLAEDLSPSRLERAKKIGERLIENLKSERVGLIFFAGEAYLQMPLTTDYRTAIIFLRNATTDQAGLQGTAIGDAILLASRRDENDLSPNQRLLIIITDGEDHEGKAKKAAADALGQGIATFTVGVGTEEGGFIPVIHGQNQDYLRDQSGQPVRTRLNNKDLQEIAQAGGGSFFNHQTGPSMYNDIKLKVERMERRNYEKSLFTARESYFQWLLFPGIFCLALPFLLELKRNRNSTVA